jgi:geranylgeranyl diphosphate synthase type II
LPRQTLPIDADVAADLLRAHGQAVEQYLRDFVSRGDQTPPRLRESILYSLMAGGKRLRPTLVLEAFSACGGKAKDRPSALAAAGAIELIHTFSLVHDDLPGMDNDDLRRGRPTNHKVFGEAMAILAGDGMVTLAFELIATEAEAAIAPALIRELAQASGPAGMIGGQVLDIDGESQNLSLDELQRLHAMKTGALLTAALRLGALAARAPVDVLVGMTDCGRHLGLAFQIVDDILDVTSTPEQLGKATQKDSAKGKNTYPSLLGLEQSRQEGQVQLNQALAILQSMGPPAAGLSVLARFVVERQV